MKYFFLVMVISFGIQASDDLIIQSLDFFENFEMVADEEFEVENNDKTAEDNNEKP